MENGCVGGGVEAELFDGRLESELIREHLKPGSTTETVRCLTDQTNYLWVFSDNAGMFAWATAYGMNNPNCILDALIKIFDVDVVSEYQHQFWGFETQEDWDRFKDEIDRGSQDEFWKQLVSLVDGGDPQFDPGIVGSQKATIAKSIADDRPELLAVDRMDDLLFAIGETYDREQGARVTQDAGEIALVEALFKSGGAIPQVGRT